MDYTSMMEKYLAEDDPEAAFAIVNDADDLPDTSGIIKIISNYLNQSVSNMNAGFFEICCAILDVIANKCKAEDVVLDLIDLIPKSEDNVAFLAYLKSLQIVMLRLPEKRLSTFKWGLSALRTYLEEYEVPELNMVDDVSETESDSSSMDTSTILYIFNGVLQFYTYLVKNTPFPIFKTVLLKFIVQLLGHPLLSLDLEETNISDIVQCIVNLAMTISTNIFAYHEIHLYKDVEKINDTSLGVLYYLVLVQCKSYKKIPRVYNHLYVFQISLSFITGLLKQSSQYPLHIGFHLFEYLIQPFQNSPLTYKLLDDDIHCKFSMTLLNALLFNSNQKLRVRGTTLFHKYLFSFEDRGRYLLVYNLTKNLNQLQSTAFIVQQYKEMLFEHFKNNFTPTKISIYYSGTNLITLICMFLKFGKGDILENYGIIISSLNFLRFLLKYDSENITHIWDFVSMLQNTYLIPLCDSLMVSKRYCNEQLKEVTAKCLKGDEISTKVNIIVGGQKLPQLESQEQVKVLQNALNMLDMVEAVTSWLMELINSRQ